MNSSMFMYEMVATVERERLMSIARQSRLEMIAAAQRNGGQPARVVMMMRALIRRMGRLQIRGAAPVAGRFDRDAASANYAALGSSAMMIARF